MFNMGLVGQNIISQHEC